MALLSFSLKALRYSRANGFSPDDLDAVKALVLWLENAKVRRYPIDGRQALQSSDKATWEAGFRQYLVDLECPIALEADNRRAVLQWLLTHAVALEYQDNAGSYQAAAASAVAAALPPEEWSEASLPPFPDALTADVAAALSELQALLHAGSSGNDEVGAVEVTPASLAAAKDMLETQILPALAEMQKAAAGGVGGSGAAAEKQGEAAGGLSAGQAAAAALLRKYPSGFSAEGGDASTDLAATVLRMLYIKNLRGLQTAIDDAIVAVQEYTANPRTDAALGKVGR